MHKHGTAQTNSQGSTSPNPSFRQFSFMRFVASGLWFFYIIPHLFLIGSGPLSSFDGNTSTMSGFEVAGLILGALPILIPAIQHIRQGLSTRKHDQQLQSLVRNLKTEQVKLQNVCERLLDGLVPPSQIQTMISHPLGDLWRDEEIARKIRARLWDRDSYDAFETTIRSIKDSVDDMVKKIDSQREGQSSLLKRGVFTLQRTSYAAALSDIKDGVASLVTLTSQSVELEPSRRVRSQGRFLTILQNLSKSLYRAIQAGLGCQCQHGLGLRLETRKAVITPLDCEDEIARNVAFRVALSYATESASAESSWREVLIKTVSTSKTMSTVTTAEAHIELPTMTSKHARFLKKYKAKKSVRFETTQSHTVTTTVSETTVSTLVETRAIPSFPISWPAVEECLSLCGRIQAAANQIQTFGDDTYTRQTYGVIVDTAKSKEYAVYPFPAAGTAAESRAWSTVSLRELLDGKHRSAYLSCRDRLQIAVIISSSVAQLHGSPWLVDDLSSRDIHFPVDGEGQLAISCGDPVLIRRPGAVGLSTLPSTSTSTTAMDRASEAIVGKRNPALLSLAYILLDLFFGQWLESFRAASAAPAAIGCGILSDYFTAQRVLEKATFPSENYRSAVSRCLQGDLHKPGIGFESEDFCQDFYSGVVALLERDFENA